MLFLGVRKILNEQKRTNVQIFVAMIVALCYTNIMSGEIIYME